MKDILAIITSGFTEAPEPATDFAFAALRKAHVTALVTEIELDSPAQMIEPDLMQGGGDEAEPLSTKERIARTVEFVHAAASRANVACTVVPELRSAALRKILIGSAQLRDVVTIDARGPLRHPLPH